MARVLIGCGANLGDPERTLEQAVQALTHESGIKVSAVSPWCSTTAVGGPAGQPNYVNGALLLDVQLTPLELLDRLHAIEAAAGRQRHQRWEARTLDLDILLYDDQVINTHTLQIPHRWLPFRSFVLDPAVTIAPDWVHPVLGRSIYQLRQSLSALPYWFVVSGGESAARIALVEQLTTQLGWHAIQPATQSDLEQMALRDLPPRDCYLSSIDWTCLDFAAHSTLELSYLVPGGNRVPLSLPIGLQRWPLPKARLVLCPDAVSTTEQLALPLQPIYEQLSPIPTLAIDISQPAQAIDEALALLRNLTPASSRAA